MTVRRAVVRALGMLALAAPMAVSLSVAAAPGALAAGGFSSPTEGQVFTTEPTITVRGNVPQCTAGPLSSCPTVTLTVTAPDNTSSKSSGTESRNGASTVTVAVTVTAKTPNGQWTAVLSGGTSGSTTFFSNYAPAVPDSFSAQGSGPRDVSFAWTKGTETDLTGYTLTDGNGTVIDSGITPASAGCASSGRCSYGLYYPSDNPGTHDYQLVAKRASGGCAGCGGSSVSSAAASASATLTAPPKPTPSPAPAAGPGQASPPGPGGTTPGGGSSAPGSGSAGAPAGSGGGGSAGNPQAKPTLPPGATNPALTRRSFALTFNAFSPSLGIPKLPPLPATDLPVVEQPLPMGTYKPSLPYSPQTVTTKTTSLLSQPVHFVSNVLDSARLARCVAFALILLAVGAHVRRYLGTHVEE